MSMFNLHLFSDFTPETLGQIYKCPGSDCQTYEAFQPSVSHDRCCFCLDGSLHLCCCVTTNVDITARRHTFLKPEELQDSLHLLRHPYSFIWLSHCRLEAGTAACVFSVSVQYIHCTVTLYCLSVSDVVFWHLSLRWISSPALIFIWHISVKQYSLFNKNTDTQSKRCLCTWSFLLWYCSSVFQSHENLMGVYVTFLLWYTVYWQWLEGCSLS